MTAWLPSEGSGKWVNWRGAVLRANQQTGVVALDESALEGKGDGAFVSYSLQVEISLPADSHIFLGER